MLAHASDVRTERVLWLMRGLVPLRGVTVVGGEKALGKSLLTNAIWTAQVTRGQTDGEYAGKPSGVLLCSAEDDWPTVIAPRLIAAGADLNRVHYPPSLIELPAAVPELEEDLRALADKGERVAMVVIDPIGAFLDGGIDSHRDASVRHALAPLAEMAMRMHVAVVVVAHLNKAEGSRIVNRVVGSVAFVNAARSFVAFSRDPEDPEGERGTRRVIVPTSANWGPLARSLSANVESRAIDLHDGSSTSVGYLNITGESDVVVEDLQRVPDGGADRADYQAAILDALADGQPHTPREVKKAIADEFGCNWKTVQRHAEALEVEGLIRREGPTSKATWALDMSPSPHMSKDENTPEIQGEMADTALFGHTGS